MKTTSFLLLLLITQLYGCISYEHALDSESYNSRKKELGNDFRFLQTESLDLLGGKNAKKEDVSTAEIKSSLKRPTYIDLNTYVRGKYGEKATFSNVVWDIKRVSFFTLQSTRAVAVTFDVYAPAK